MTRLVRPAALIAALLAPAAVLAEPAAVTPCADRALAFNLVEPWEQNTATYGNGAIRIALLDTVEPAAAAVHLMVISPPLDELGLRQCRVVSLSPGSGFYDLDFAARSADYDSARGLTLTFPAERFVPDTGMGSPAKLTVTVNQQSGQIAADLK